MILLSVSAEYLFTKEFKMKILVNCLILITIISFNAVPQDGEVKIVEGGEGIYSVAFSTTGDTIIYANENGNIEFFDINSNASVKTISTVRRPINSMILSLDGQLIASASKHRSYYKFASIKIWIIKNGLLYRTFNEIPYGDDINCIDLSPDGHLIVSGLDDGSVKIQNIQKKFLLKSYKVHDEQVNTVAFHPSGKFVVSAGDDGKIIIWSIDEASIINTLLGHTDAINQITMSKDGKVIISAGEDKTIRLWNFETGKEINKFVGHSSEVRCVDMSPGGRFLASGDKEGNIIVWYIYEKKEIKRFNKHSDEIYSLSFHPQKFQLVSSSADGSVILWDEFLSRTELIQNYLEGEIKSYVEKKISRWQLKGEFESKEEYLDRMSKRDEKIKEFTPTAGEFIKEKFIRDNKIWENMSLGEYETESETFEISFGHLGNIILPVPVSDAREFKKHFINNSVKIKNEEIVLQDSAFVINSAFEINSGFVIRYIELLDTITEKLYTYDSKIELIHDPVNDLALQFKPINIKVEDYSKPDFEDGRMDNSISELPQTNMKNPNAIAVVIGNSNYKRTKKVKYSINDAYLMKKYLVKVLGYKEGNIFYIQDATKGEFELFFGNDDYHKGKLFNSIKPNKSDVFIYYSGHGAPGLKDKKGYFVPVECDPNYVELQGYPIDVFYKNLSKLPAKSITVVLDACFSGATIFDNISPISITIENPSVKMENAVILSSSSGVQVSTWYNEKKHGMFTYFFLKAIHDKENSDKNADNKLTFREIYEYISDKSEGVPYYARRIHGVEQDPTISGDAIDSVFVEY